MGAVQPGRVRGCWRGGGGSFAFQDATARTAWGNATTQTGQLTAFRALWSGDVTVRYYTSGGTHLGTATHSGWDAIDTGTTPYSVTLAGRPAWSRLADGTAAYCIVAVPGGADIIRADVSLAKVVNASNGIVNLDDGAGAAGLVVNATASLPASGLAGTVTTIGTQSLYDYLGTVYSALPEGLAAADTRMNVRIGVMSYCGATIWRNKYAVPISGGHGDSYDDGAYAQDLTTGAWETLLGPTTFGSSAAVSDANGEWTGGTSGRPASQHTLQHLITVGDDMIQGSTAFAGTAANGSKQAHRWNYSSGLWERYGDNGGGISPNDGCFVHYDAARSRIVRINFTQVYGKLDTIPSNNAAATWTSITSQESSRIGTSAYSSMGYHEALDCYVMIDPQGLTPRNTVYVMDPDDLVTGWLSVSVSGEVPSSKFAPGLEYCPPKQCMVSVDTTVNNKLFYITPTGAMTDPWVWSSETFTGSVAALDGNGGGDYNGVYSRFRCSTLLGGFVMLKQSHALTELYVPTV